MKSELEVKFDTESKKVIDDFLLTLYTIEVSEDSYSDMCALYEYIRDSIVHDMSNETFDDIVKESHECSATLMQKFKNVMDFMDDFYEENKDYPVTEITKIARWIRSVWINIYTSSKVMSEYVEYRLKYLPPEIRNN